MDIFWNRTLYFSNDRTVIKFSSSKLRFTCNPLTKIYCLTYSFPVWSPVTSSELSYNRCYRLWPLIATMYEIHFPFWKVVGNLRYMLSSTMTTLILHPRKHNFHDTRPQLDKCLTYAPGEGGGGAWAYSKNWLICKKKTSVKLNNLISKLHFKATHKAL